jgi:hypothetical protein
MSTVLVTQKRGTPVNQQQAMQIAERLDPSEGEVIFFTNDGMIFNPHSHSGLDLGPLHTDAYACRRQFGTIQVAKIHSDDFECGAEPDWMAIWF